jgi:hypothetical protein
MRWIITKDEFERVRLEANTCKYVDSRRYPTDLQLWTFQDGCISTLDFGRLIQNLLMWSDDRFAVYIVLVPDPIWYFWHHFAKYPALNIEAGDSAEAYLRAVNEDPGGSPADAVGTNWWELVVVPPSRKWFVHALREHGEGGGHLWIPREWAAKVLESFSYLTKYKAPGES